MVAKRRWRRRRSMASSLAIVSAVLAGAACGTGPAPAHGYPADSAAPPIDGGLAEAGVEASAWTCSPARVAPVMRSSRKPGTN
jgi:hypothetical protein